MSNKPTEPHCTQPEPHNQRRGDVSAMLRIAEQVSDSSRSTLQQKRQMIAEFFRMLSGESGAGANGVSHNHHAHASPFQPPAAALPSDTPALPPRLQQTLQRLLEGRSEKEVARDLDLSHHTVHVYVKTLYRRFNVSSRAELLAKHLHR